MLIHKEETKQGIKDKPRESYEILYKKKRKRWQDKHAIPTIQVHNSLRLQSKIEHKRWKIDQTTLLVYKIVSSDSDSSINRDVKWTRFCSGIFCCVSAPK